MTSKGKKGPTFFGSGDCVVLVQECLLEGSSLLCSTRIFRAYVQPSQQSHFQRPTFQSPQRGNASHRTIYEELLRMQLGAGSVLRIDIPANMGRHFKICVFTIGEYSVFKIGDLDRLLQHVNEKLRDACLSRTTKAAAQIQIHLLFYSRYNI